MGTGRPRKHSDEAIAKALREAGGVRSDAARKLGYSHEGLNRRIKSSPMLTRVLEEEQVVLQDAARSGIAAAIHAECQRAEAAAASDEGPVPSMTTCRCSRHCMLGVICPAALRRGNRSSSSGGTTCSRSSGHCMLGVTCPAVFG